MDGPGVPQYCPTARELDDLELLLSGGYGERTSYDAAGPVSLHLPDDVAERARAAGAVELVDPEGTPLARVGDDGGVTGLAQREHGPFRRLHLPPAVVRERHPDALTVPVDAPLTGDDLTRIAEARDGRPVLLLALAGDGTPRSTSAVGLVRATLAAARLVGDAGVVAVTFPHHPGAGESAQADLRAEVVAAYAPGDVLDVPGSGEVPAAVAEVVRQDRPAPDEQGLVVFFTGLSGSGKSTLARALHDLLLEDGRRTVTSLDGDVVRRSLSAGLTFSRADRETNIRRIGWVAAEISRHRGVAICSPIAPFDATRRQVRAYVDEAGGAFFLVHVATPLKECERRDRKGLYAKARRGEVAEFTGISSPYEEPADADVVVDTTGRTVEDVLADVLDGLRRSGHLDLGSTPWTSS